MAYFGENAPVRQAFKILTESQIRERNEQGEKRWQSSFQFLLETSKTMQHLSSAV